MTLEGVGSLGQALVSEDGLWSVVFTGAPPAPGARAFTAVITDRAGNTGPASAPYVVDTSIAAPVITAISDDTGASATDRITRDTTLILSGTAAAGTTVTLSRAGAGALGTATVAPDGSWTFDYTWHSVRAWRLQLLGDRDRRVGQQQPGLCAFHGHG